MKCSRIIPVKTARAGAILFHKGYVVFKYLTTSPLTKWTSCGWGYLISISDNRGKFTVDCPQWDQGCCLFVHQDQWPESPSTSPGYLPLSGPIFHANGGDIFRRIMIFFLFHTALVKIRHSCMKNKNKIKQKWFAEAGFEPAPTRLKSNTLPKK